MVKSTRSMKVVAQSGYKYRDTPTITLKGLWLATAGFEIGDYVTVSCEDGRLVITPDTERAVVKQAEAEFMEREMKALRKKFETEKAKIHERFVSESESDISMVAESGMGYGV